MTRISAHIDTFVRDNLPPADEQPRFLLDDLPYQLPDKLNAAQLFFDRATQNAWNERIALRNLDSEITYQELQEWACQIAHTLSEDCDLLPGERVLMQGTNSIAQVATWFGVLLAGGISVMAMPLLRARDLKPIAQKARVSLVVGDDNKLPDLEDVGRDTDGVRYVMAFPQTGELSSRKDPFATTTSKLKKYVGVPTAADDPAIIAFTSGTTGKSKGCVHLHQDIIAMCEGFCRHTLKPEPDDVFIGSPPLAFTFGLGALVTFPLYFGASSVLLEKATPPDLAAAVQATDATVMFTAPTGYRAILSKFDEHDLSSLRNCISAGEHLPLPVYEEWLAKTNTKIIDGIGATELLHIFISAAGDDIRPGAIGKTIPGYEAKIFDENMKELPIGEVGRLDVRGPTGCRYLADERQDTYVRDGWNVTGDMFRRDGDGYFYFVARSDDMIISSGYNISGPEVEQVLLDHDAVSECAVVASPDANRGSVVKAYVVANETHSPSDALVKVLQDFVKQEVAPYKYPRRIEFVSTLPKTQTGKIQRFKLRDQEANQKT